jgi:hypothetical protein
MATSYKYKQKQELVFEANKKRLRLEGQILLADLLNEAVSVMSDRFNEAYLEGTILELDGNRDELKSYLLEAANRELTPGA